MNTPKFSKDIFRRALEAQAGGKIEHIETIEAVERWMDSGLDGLVLMGSVGTGKTTIAHALRYAWQQFLTIARIYSCDWIAQQIKADESWKYEISNCSGLLILDDLGTEPKVWNEEVMPFILYQRYERRMPTVITTNLNSDQLRGKYGDRIADRLRTYGKIVMDYKSLRR